MYKRILKNTTALDINLEVIGMIVPAMGQLEIARMNYSLLGNENVEAELVPYVISGDIVLNDGDSDLPVKPAISLLKSNYLLLQDYYTLMQDDDILIGNGQILVLHDPDWQYETLGEQEDT